MLIIFQFTKVPNLFLCYSYLKKISRKSQKKFNVKIANHLFQFMACHHDAMIDAWLNLCSALDVFKRAGCQFKKRAFLTQRLTIKKELMTHYSLVPFLSTF